MIAKKFANRLLRLIKRAGKNWFQQFKLIQLEPLLVRLSRLPDYPASAATPQQLLSLTLLGAERTYTSLSVFAGFSDINSKIIDIHDLPAAPNQFLIQENLKNLFDRHGSDKAMHHNYHHLYAWIIANLGNESLQVMEIGLGTNNTDTPSNMGKTGQPGASLRAWRDYSDKCEVIGLDIDDRVLFKEERIRTYQLDQTDNHSWEMVSRSVESNSVNLLIDDGLHSPDANLKSLIHGPRYISKGGFLVIEDIDERTLPIWRIVTSLTPNTWETWMIRSNKAYLFVAKIG
jgi:hypothetical protein